jgi:hypothetical protein
MNAIPSNADQRGKVIKFLEDAMMLAEDLEAPPDRARTRRGPVAAVHDQAAQ